MKRITNWTISNAVFAAALWFAIIHHNEGAKNVALFIAWVTIVTSLFMFSNDGVKFVRRRGKPPIPHVVDVAFDATVITFMLYNGWIATAIGYFIHSLAIAYAYDKAFGNASDAAQEDA